MGRRKSRAEAAIEAQLATLDPSSERFAVLTAARDFKSAWVALGDVLTSVRETGTYEQWGYRDFDSYCRRELHLRMDTANKLTRSFAFLRDHEPEALASHQERDLPPLDVVDLLTQARERSRVTPKQLETIRGEVFDPEAKIPTRNEVVKRFREFDPEAFRGSAKKPSDEKAPTGDNPAELRKALLLADRLLSLVEVQPGLSPKAVDGVRRAASELRTLFEAQDEQKSA